MTTNTKTEEQITKDKEAVLKMIGAKSAMEAAQRRIELLERTLKLIDSRCQVMKKALGDTIFFNIYHVDNYKVRNSSEIFNELAAEIRKVL